MRFAVFDEYRIGVVDGEALRDVSAAVPERWRGTPYAINELIAGWDGLREEVRSAADSGDQVLVADVQLLPPVPRPRQLLAAPLNYANHVDEMVDSKHAPDELKPQHSPRQLGFFAKSPGSICGPSDSIELPAWPGRSFHHEVELGVVIGKCARGVSAEGAASHIFGYLCLLDITLRIDGDQQEERTMRKSFETFTPIGPFLVTADEVGDNSALDLELRVNGEPRQAANTAQLIAGVDELIAQASSVVTLHPGDIYATGTPEGVGPIEPGDLVSASVERVGDLEMKVVQRSW